jgi:hypothetical protein
MKCICWTSFPEKSLREETPEGHELATPVLHLKSEVERPQFSTRFAQISE